MALAERSVWSGETQAIQQGIQARSSSAGRRARVLAEVGVQGRVLFLAFEGRAAALDAEAHEGVDVFDLGPEDGGTEVHLFLVFFEIGEGFAVEGRGGDDPDVAEGCGRETNKELARFIDIATGSASEVEYQLLLARDLGYLSREQYAPLTAETVEIRRMLIAFKKKLRD